MARNPRYTPHGTVQHFISRIAGGEHRIAGPLERAELSARFGRALARCDWRALAFAWMSNHEHLAARAGKAPADSFLRPAHTGFARWLNDRTQDRFGHVYAGRPDNVTFTREESVARLLAYIHNNPVRAGVAVDPLGSDWTSHRAYIGEAAAPDWLDVDLGLSLSGFSASGNGRASFHDFVRSRAGLPRDPSMTAEHSPRMRTAVRQELRAPVEVAPHRGRRSFCEIVARPGTRLPEPSAPGDEERLLCAVAAHTGVPEELLTGRTRARIVTDARRLALIVWTQLLSRPAAELAPVLGVSQQACSRLLSDQRRVASHAQAARTVRALMDELRPARHAPKKL